MSPARVFGVVLALVLTVGTSWLSRVPSDFAGEDEALLRLSWRAEGVTAEACRVLSEEELEALPMHMKNPQACIGTIAPFELSVSLGGEPVVRDTVLPGGARGDRPIYVLRDLPVPPGAHRLSVRFVALLPDGLDVGEVRTDYVWDGDVVLGPGEVALLTRDEQGNLELRTPGR